MEQNTETTNVSKPANPFTKALAIQIEMSKWGVRRPVKSEDLDQIMAASGVEVDKEQLSMSKKLIKCDEYDAIGSVDRQVRKALSGMSLPAILADGAYLIPYKLVGAAREIIKSYREQREILIDRFLQKYEGDLLDKEIQRLGPLFNRTQYPPLGKVSDSFSIEISYPTFKPDAELKNIDEAAYNEALQDTQRRMDEAAEKIQLAMRAGLLKLLDNLSGALGKVQDNGKPGVFKDATIEHVNAFLAVFDSRNLTEDSDLATIVQRCQKVISGVAPEDLRKDLDLRAQVVAKINEASKDLADLVKSAPGRKFDLSELSEAEEVEA